jgi:MFS superfamily sulfate permease-like transporter
MSQSLVNESAGARTPMSGLIAALIVLIVVLFLSSTLRDLPQPVLAAIVLMAVLGLVKVKTLKRLWRNDRSEFFIAMAALAGVLTSGLLRGVLIGAVISIILLIRRASRPHVAFLGRIPGTRRFSDMSRHADNEPIPGLVIVRTEGSVVYFNAQHVRDTVVTRVHQSAPPPKVVLFDLSNTPFIDLAGAEMIRELQQELCEGGIQLRLVEARSAVRDRLRAEGLEEHIGRVDRITTVADAVDEMAENGGARAEAEAGRTA